MAENTELNPGEGGDVIATDDIDGVKHQRVKVQHGADGSATDVSEASPLPVKVNSVIPGTGPTNLGKAEDAVHASGDTGVMPLGVRKDDPVSPVADGGYAPFIISKEGALWTENLPSEVDAGNSSVAPLGIGAVFTGTGITLLDHQAVTVMIDASHDSAVDGMQFQFSSDNINWDVSLDFTYTAGGGRTFQFGMYAQYFRIVYANGGTAQTHFRCQTLLHHGTTLTTIHQLVDNTSPDRSAEIVKSVIIAQAGGTGDFIPVQATNNGNFKIALDEYDGVPIGNGEEAGSLRVTLSGGTGLHKNIDVDETKDTVKATAGRIYWIHAINLSAAPRYLKFYNATVGNVIVGTTVPDLTFPIPSPGDANGAGFTISIPNGIGFDTAITIAATTGLADNDSGAPGDNEVIVNLGYS